MPTNLTQNQVQATSTSEFTTGRAKSWANALNKFLVTSNQSPIAFEASTLESMKSFTGANAATGSGLLDTRIITPITYVGTRGGVFIESGIDYRPNSGFDMKVNSFSLNGTYAQIACGTATENEISTFATGTVSLLRERAEIQGCEDLIARTPDKAQLLLAFEQALENEKLVLADRKVAVAITSNASTVAIDPASIGALRPIALAMYQMQGNIGGLYSNPGIGHRYYMSPSGYSRFLRSQDAEGNFSCCNSHFERAYGNTGRPDVGLMGYFDGYPVYVTNGILNTYTANATGVITAQTGGANTAVLFGLPYTLTLGRGLSDLDQIIVFDATTDRQSYYEGEVTVGAVTYMAAVLKAPAAWNYYAF